MGYQTEFVISADEEVLEKLCNEPELSHLEMTGSALRAYAKWYGWHADMRAVSQRYPNTLITVNGAGEEPGDLWRAFFMSGKSQVCDAIITYEEFDESKLT